MKITSNVYLFSFVVLAFVVCFSDGLKVDVKIINGMDINMNVQCKSKDDDLGVQLLPPDLDFEFKFEPNLLGTTLFFCRFWWGSESHWFDIYIQKRDSGRCIAMCWWKVFPTGPCLFNPGSGEYTTCESWNKEHLQGSGNDTTTMFNDSKYLEAREERGK